MLPQVKGFAEHLVQSESKGIAYQLLMAAAIQDRGRGLSDVMTGRFAGTAII